MAIVGVAFARKTSKTRNTNFPKTLQNPLGHLGKFLGRANFYIEIFFPESENYSKGDFLGVKVGNFSSEVRLFDPREENLYVKVDKAYVPRKATLKIIAEFDPPKATFTSRT